MSKANGKINVTSILWNNTVIVRFNEICTVIYCKWKKNGVHIMHRISPEA